MRCVHCSEAIDIKDPVFAFGKLSPLCQKCFITVQEDAPKPKRGALEQIFSAIPFIRRW